MQCCFSADPLQKKLSNTKYFIEMWITNFFHMKFFGSLWTPSLHPADPTLKTTVRNKPSALSHSFLMCGFLSWSKRRLFYFHVSETSRLFPTVPIIFRICTENYQLPDSDYVVKRGQVVFIPVIGLHRDPQYFPDPEVFNPENFSEEAKASRPSCCFLPFGDGPRNCIGEYSVWKALILSRNFK